MSSIKNALLTRFDSGFRTDSSSSSISANGRREGFLALGQVRNSPNTTTAINQYLSTLGSGATTLTAEIVPTTTAETPYVGQWEPGASITVPRPSNAGAAETVQVRAMTVSEDDNGVVSFTPELIRSVETRASLTNRTIQRLGNGTLAGRSAAASIATDIDVDAKYGRVADSSTTFTKDTLEATTSPAYNPTDYQRVLSVFASLNTVGSTSTTFQILANNTPISFQVLGSSSTTLTIPAGVYAIYGVTTTHVEISPLVQLTCSIVTYGTGAAKFSAQVAFGER